MILHGYSLWLTPKGETYKHFFTLIAKLAKAYNSPVFAPHVTLLGMLKDHSEEIILQKVAMLADSHTCFPLTLEEIGFEDFFYRALFVRAKKTPELLSLNQNTREAFAMQDEPAFMPHLSLLYGDFPISMKEKIRQEIGTQGRVFDVTGITLVHANGHEDTWRIITEIPLRSI